MKEKDEIFTVAVMKFTSQKQLDAFSELFNLIAIHPHLSKEDADLVGKVAEWKILKNNMGKGVL